MTPSTPSDKSEPYPSYTPTSATSARNPYLSHLQPQNGGGGQGQFSDEPDSIGDLPPSPISANQSFRDRNPYRRNTGASEDGDILDPVEPRYARVNLLMGLEGLTEYAVPKPWVNSDAFRG